MNDSFQYGDIIFLGIIAVFVILRLRAMVGKDQGIDPKMLWKNQTPSAQNSNVVVFPTNAVKKEPEEDEFSKTINANPALAEGLTAIQKADNHFDAKEFLEGAKIAFEWVIEAYSKQEKDKLQMILSPERYHHFIEAIDAMMASGERQETTLVAITNAEFTEAKLVGNRAIISVAFASEQMSVTRNSENVIIAGDSSQIEHAHDIFTFERDVTSRDPNWIITAT